MFGKAVAWCLIALCMLPFVAGCSQQAATPTINPAPSVRPATDQPAGDAALIGKWSGPCKIALANFSAAEFMQDGTLTLDDQSGKYTLIDAQRLNVVFALGRIEYGYKIAGNSLTLTDAQGTSCTIQRAQ